MSLRLKWIFVLLYWTSEVRAFAKHASKENKQNGSKETECFLLGGYCIEEQHCLNGAKMETVCGNQTKSICCLPADNKQKCIKETCDGLVQDCSRNEDFARFNPLVCGPIKRCGITNTTYHKICRSSPSLQLVCCAEETYIKKSADGFQTLEVGPDGVREGILFDTRYIENERWKRRLKQIPLILAVVGVMVAFFSLTILLYITTNKYLKKTTTQVPTNVNRRVRFNPFK